MTAPASDGFEAYYISKPHQAADGIDMFQQTVTSKSSGLPCNRVALRRHAGLQRNLMFKLNLFVQLHLLISLGVQLLGQARIEKPPYFCVSKKDHPTRKIMLEALTRNVMGIVRTVSVCEWRPLRNVSRSDAFGRIRLSM